MPGYHGADGSCPPDTDTVNPTAVVGIIVRQDTVIRRRTAERGVPPVLNFLSQILARDAFLCGQPPSPPAATDVFVVT